MDQPHNGTLWLKVAEMNLPERELIESFDSEADFVNYMNRAPKISWDSVKGSHMEKLKAKSKSVQEGSADDTPMADDAETDHPPKVAKRIADLKSELARLEGDE